MDVSWSNFFSNLLFILTCFFHYTTTLKQEGGCYFPERWEGTWFQSGVRQPILIEGPRLSSKGRCLASEGDKFLVVDDKKCYRCVVIHEKHANVLQYKETFCLSRDSLTSLCSLITGDALLYSMFRENASPVACPFRGPYTFTYNRGHGECRYPVSSIDSCTEDSRLLLSYQACPDVHGTESTVEELQCLATWKEGSSRYLVGRVHHSHATSNEDRFRCFVYEKSSPTSESLDGVDYRVAQSGDATCNGLFSATEGSRTMTLKRAPSLNKCRFPSWLANFNHWHTLDYTATYSFHHRNSTLRVTNSSGLEMKVVCSLIKHQARDDSSVMIVAHFTMGCQNGYMCVVFYRRDSHVMEVQTGIHARRPEDSCTPLYFNKTALPYITLVTTTPEPRKCPYLGKFSVTTLITTGQQHQDRDRRSPKHHRDRDLSRIVYGEAGGGFYNRRIKRVNRDPDCESEGFSDLVVGCNSIDTMEFHSECSTPDLILSYSCHGRWEENGTHYLITTPLSRASHGARRYCFIYREQGPDMVLFSTSSDSCDRTVSPGSTGGLVFNATSTGKCIEVNGTSKPDGQWSKALLLLCFATLLLQSNFFVHVER